MTLAQEPQGQEESNMMSPRDVKAAPLLCEWNHGKMEAKTTSLDSEDAASGQRGSELLCGWKHSHAREDAKATSSRQDDNTLTDIASSLTNSSNALPQSELLCEWKHPVDVTPSPATEAMAAATEGMAVTTKHIAATTKDTASNTKDTAATSRAKSRPRPRLQRHEQLLCEWKEIPKPSPLAKESRSQSDPNMLFMSDDSMDSGSEADEGFLARVGTSMRNLFAEPTTEASSPTRPPIEASRPAMKRIQSVNRRKLNRKKSNREKQEEDGVVTYLGKQYSARDLFQRCNNSARTMSSHDSNNTLESVEPLEEKPQYGGNDLRSCLVRGLSSMALGGGNLDEPLASQSLHNNNRRSKSPFREGRPPRRSRSTGKLPGPSSSYTMQKSRSTVQLTDEEVDEHLDFLQVDQNDILDIAESPQDFAALKRTLKKNKAITNGLLQQGLHVFVHQHREQKQRREQREFQLQQQQRQSQRNFEWQTQRPSSKKSSRAAISA